MILLNVAEICPATRTLGTGKRFVIWVQGCCFNCPGCVSPDWIPQKQATQVDIKRLAEYIVSMPDIDGLTVSGGEPMLQAKALSELFSYIRAARDISIICYSGFTLEQLQAKSKPAINQILTQIDVLIDGLYVDSLNDNQGFRGSSNQIVHFLTPRHILDVELFTQRHRDVEIHIRDTSALMVGVPPINFAENFKQVIL